jgi:hypothetical protein
MISLRHLAPNPNLATHSIDAQKHNLRTSLNLKGMISGFPIRYPATKELESCTCVNLTNEQEWKPNSNDFEEHELSVDRNILGIDCMPP